MTKPSIFFKASSKGYRFSIPLFALEVLNNSSDSQTDWEEAIGSALEACGILEPTEDDVAYFLERVTENLREDKQEVRKSSKLDRGHRYREFISELPVDHKILLMSGFDFAKAEQLYKKVDKSIVYEMLDTYFGQQIESFEYIFGCVLYGMGGEYKEGTGVTDISEMSDEEQEEALNNFFGALH